MPNSSGYHFLTPLGKTNKKGIRDKRNFSCDSNELEIPFGFFDPTLGFYNDPFLMTLRAPPTWNIFLFHRRFTSGSDLSVEKQMQMHFVNFSTKYGLNRNGMEWIEKHTNPNK